MVNRREELWKRIAGAVLERRAVRMVFVGPEAPRDPRVERALQQGKAAPLPPEFVEAVKRVLDLVPRKEELFTGLKERADKAMSEVWQRLWKTPEGKEYEALKADLESRKQKVNAQAKKLEDGIYAKLVQGGQQFRYIKTSFVVSREEALQTAQGEVDRLRGELEAAKARLRDLQRSKETLTERLNVLVVEELGGRAHESLLLLSPWGARRADRVTVAELAREIYAVDELVLEPLEAIDSGLGELIEVMDGVAEQPATPVDIPQEEEIEDPAEVAP